MRKVLSVLVVTSLVTVIFLSLFITGCSWKPSEQELQALEDSKAAALAAEEAQSACENEKAEADRMLAEAKQKLEKMNQEKVNVTNRLENM